jgi:protein-tyrosine phosphatase
MAAGLLRDRLAQQGIPADVSSAGLMAGGAPAARHAVKALRRRGIDLSEHRSRALAAEDVASADLVLGMERRHVREAVVLVPEATSYAFTLRDLVRRATAAEPRTAGETLRAWAARLAAGRTTADLMGEGDDAITDPMGGPRALYDRTAEELEGLVDDLLSRAFPNECGAQRHRMDSAGITTGSDARGRR